MKRLCAGLVWASVAVAEIVPASAQQPPAGRVATGPVLTDCLVTLTDEARLAAGEAGLLDEVLVKPGDRVAQGQVIARINADQPRSELEKAGAELEQAAEKSNSDVDVRFAIASKDVASVELQKARDANVRSPNAFPEVEINRLKLTEKKAELQIEQANLERKLAGLAVAVKKAEVQAAEINIRRREIKAPFAGQVEKVAKNRGEWTQPGDFIAHLISPDKLEVEGYVKAADWNPEQVRGRPVTVEVRLAAGRREQAEGRVTVVSEVQEHGEYRVVAEVANHKSPGSDEWVLHGGQIVTMAIHSDRPPAP